MALVFVAVDVTQPTVAVPTGAVRVEVRGAPVGELVVTLPGSTAPGESDPMTQLGTGNYEYQASGLTPGSKTLTVVDGGTADSIATTFVIARAPVPGCTDPAADNYDPNATQDDGSCAYTPPPHFPHVVFSAAQALRFVLPGDPGRPAYDNRLLADQDPLNVTNPGYCQKVERGDTLVVQWQSNYNGAHQVQVVPQGGGAAVLNITPTRVVVGAGTTRSFEAYARLEVATGKTRIYFNDDALPLPFLPGARVTLANAGLLSGTYPVADVREDADADVPYLLLNVPYPGGAQRIDLDLTTPYALQAFDTWQAVVPFAAVPAGCHQVRVSAIDAGFGTATALSEPLDVAASHPNTVEVVYRNFDNAFGLNYTAGLLNRVRVVARFFERETPTQKTTLRESTGRLVLLNAEAQRRVKLTTFLLPDWMHEKLALAFCHDSVRVDGLKGIAEEKYDYPPTPAYALSNGSIQVEQEDFLGAGNRDDLGDVDGGTLLLVNQKFLKVNF